MRYSSDGSLIRSGGECRVSEDQQAVARVDESVFSVLYGKKKFRPNTPVNVPGGLDTLKSVYGGCSPKADASSGRLHDLAFFRGVMNAYKNARAESLAYESYDRMLSRWNVHYHQKDVETRCGTTHCIVAGDPSRPPLLLFHGVGDNSAVMWFRNIEALAKRFHCVAVDTLGGPGRSRPNAKYATQFVQLAWQLEVVDALGLDCVNLLGVSNGAYMAYNMCVKAPERVHKAVCIEGGMVSHPLRSMYSVLGMMMPEMLIPTRGNLRKAMTKLMSPRSGFAEEHPYVIDHLLTLMRTHNRKAMYVHRIDPYVELEGILRRKNLLFLIGDHKIGAKRSLLADLKHGAYTYEVIADAGHALNHEQSEIVNARVKEFLQGQPLSALRRRARRVPRGGSVR